MFGPSAAPDSAERRSAPVASAAAAALATEVQGKPELAAFYANRGYRPLWMEGNAASAAARQLVELLGDAAADGLDPARYRAAALARNLTGPMSPATEIALSEAYIEFQRDLHRTPAGSAMTYVDRELAPETRAAPILKLAPMRGMHPLYEGLRQARGTPGLSPSRAALLRLNMDRARALPGDGRRHIVVDTASARLWLYEGNRAVDSMRVIVGKPRLQTPMLAGLIRFAVFAPYWNLPPDLIRERAHRVVAEGLALLTTERLELLSDWGPEPRVLDPLEVDWAGVAAGSVPLRMRQLPGPDNMMGAVKFMLPNRLGIYLHDTPDKAAFTRVDRRLSSGCVRVEDAPRLARWLFAGAVPLASGALDQRMDLTQPVPVYIGYFTALPAGERILYQPDLYRRDAIPLRSALQKTPREAGRSFS